MVCIGKSSYVERNIENWAFWQKYRTQYSLFDLWYQAKWLQNKAVPIKTRTCDHLAILHCRLSKTNINKIYDWNLWVDGQVKLHTKFISILPTSTGATRSKIHIVLVDLHFRSLTVRNTQCHNLSIFLTNVTSTVIHKIWSWISP